MKINKKLTKINKNQPKSMKVNSNLHKIVVNPCQLIKNQ